MNIERRIGTTDEETCSHEQPYSTRYGCELVVGHPGDHAALVGARDEVSWPDRERDEARADLDAAVKSRGDLALRLRATITGQESDISALRAQVAELAGVLRTAVLHLTVDQGAGEGAHNCNRDALMESARAVLARVRP